MKPIIWYEHHVGHYDAELYLGISNGVAGRTKRHSVEKPYFELFPVTIVARPFPPGTTRRQAMDYERRQINERRPPFNKQHNPDYRRQQRLRSQILSGAPSRFVPLRGIAAGVQWLRVAARFAVVGGAGAVIGAVAVVL